MNNLVTDTFLIKYKLKNKQNSNFLIKIIQQNIIFHIKTTKIYNKTYNKIEINKFWNKLI